MTQTAINYAKVLHQLNISRESIGIIKEVIQSVPEVQEALEAPVITKEEKYRVTDRIFPEET